MTVFQDVATYSLVETNRRFRCAYCLSHLGDKSSASQKTVIFSLMHVLIVTW
jgi:hypothetical protein